MRKKKLRILIIISGAILICSALYYSLPMDYKWAITSGVEVPICTSRIADKLELEADYLIVKDHIIQSLKLGMTPNEVEKTLKQFAPIEVSGTFYNDRQEMNETILIKLCDNPFGNIGLFVLYSKDGRLINIVDAFED